MPQKIVLIKKREDPQGLASSFFNELLIGALSQFSVNKLYIISNGNVQLIIASRDLTKFNHFGWKVQCCHRLFLLRGNTICQENFCVASVAINFECTHYTETIPLPEIALEATKHFSFFSVSLPLSFN